MTQMHAIVSNKNHDEFRREIEALTKEGWIVTGTVYLLRVKDEPTYHIALTKIVKEGEKA